MSNEKSDVEAQLLYPSMEERPELRWAFIRKVYSILTLQLLATIAVAALVSQYPSIAIFIRYTWVGWVVYVLLIIALIIVICLLTVFESHHPFNFLLLGIFVVFVGFVIGLTTTFVSGAAILEAAIATAAVVVSLTIYTFWAAKKGQDFGFLEPFLFSLVIALFTFALFLIFVPMWRSLEMIYSIIGVLIFSAYIIFDTNVLIAKISYDQYILASVVLYFDILNIFVWFLRIFGNRR